jgi:hypothetical protein
MIAGPAVVEESATVTVDGEITPLLTVTVDGVTVPRLVERFTVPF